MLKAKLICHKENVYSFLPLFKRGAPTIGDGDIE